MAGRAAASFTALAEHWIKRMTFSILAISFPLPESSPSKTANKCAKSLPKCRSINSWSKRIVLIWRRSRSAENGANRRTRGWSRKKLRKLAVFHWKKSLARQPQLRKNSSDLSAGKIDMGKLKIVGRHVFVFGAALILASAAPPRAADHHT